MFFYFFLNWFLNYCLFLVCRSLRVDSSGFSCRSIYIFRNVKIWFSIFVNLRLKSNHITDSFLVKKFSQKWFWSWFDSLCWVLFLSLIQWFGFLFFWNQLLSSIWFWSYTLKILLSILRNSLRRILKYNLLKWFSNLCIYSNNAHLIFITYCSELCWTNICD